MKFGGVYGSGSGSHLNHKECGSEHLNHKEYGSGNLNHKEYGSGNLNHKEYGSEHFNYTIREWASLRNEEGKYFMNIPYRFRHARK